MEIDKSYWLGEKGETITTGFGTGILLASSFGVVGRFGCLLWAAREN